MNDIYDEEYYNLLKVKFLINAPFIYIYSNEYDRVQNSIRLILDDTKIVNTKTNFFIWSFNKGFLNYSTNETKYKETRLYNLIDIINGLTEKTVFLLRDLDRLFEEDTKRIAVLIDCISQIKKGSPAIIVASCSNIFIPDELETSTELLKLPLLNTNEVVKFSSDIFAINDYYIDNITIKLLASALVGLTQNEMESIMYEILIKAANEKRMIGPVDIDSIILKKKDIVNKSGVLELVLDRVPMESVGGLKNLKSWLNDRKKILNNMDAAEENGLKPPRGILMFGVPGSGKSMTSKMVATHYNLPLLRFDLGLIFGQRSAENSMLRALSLAESIAPCVLWLDEVEKVFAGAGISAGSNANADINRIFGQLLTWMQEHKKNIFISLTSNNISQLEPTLYRDGRISERFFLGFIRTEADLKSVFEVHLHGKLKDSIRHIVKPLNYTLILKKMDQMVAKYRGVEYAGYSGANIEALLEKVLEYRYFNDLAYVETKDFIYMLNDVKPQHGYLIKEMLNKANEMDAINA